MDENLKKIIPFALKYKKDVVMNIIYNILYALFSTLSFVALIPMLDVLFKDAEKIVKEPKLNSIWEITSYGNDYLYFYITKLNNENGAQYALLLPFTILPAANNSRFACEPYAVFVLGSTSDLLFLEGFI